MKSIIKNSAGILIAALLGLLLITSTAAIADRDHHRHDRHSYGGDHYYDSDRSHKDRRHYKRHKRHNNHRHYRSYGQPRGYYNRQYRYNTGYNQYPQQVYNTYYPSQSYGYRPNVSLGINAGNTSFMLRY